jgi:predicted phosphodiesterase
MKILLRALKVIGIAAIVLVVVYSGIAVLLYSSSGRIPQKRTPYPPVRIKNLIWPTVGFPELVTPGSSLEVEFDPNAAGPGNVGGEKPPSGWRAVLKPVRYALSGLRYGLQPVRVWQDASSHWPGGTSRGGPHRVWHAEFKVPADAVRELYDLTVEADTGSGRLSDSQPHAVSISETEDDDFRFATLSDIHVHRRNISGAFRPQTNKGISLEGRPVFFEEAIRQVNLIHPDFVILLGDFVRAQQSRGDYQVEFENFYNALSEFEVPVFVVPGNHDQYINEVDGAQIWEESLGPLYYSFDVARCHFTAVNTYEWPNSDRIVMSKLGLFVYPRKWQGQVLDAGDENDEGSYAGQLAWIRDDLRAHQGSKLRVMLMHHDPYRPGGTGKVCWEDRRFVGLYTLGGDGKGRTALKRLASQYRVAYAFTGHTHSDYIGSEEWMSGTGETVYANQTCVYFDEGGVQEKYPGYRLVDVREGGIKGVTYLNHRSSVPFYDGSIPGGKTDLDHLERPALSAHRVNGDDGQAAATGWKVENYLAVPVVLDGLVLETVRSQAGYAVGGGEVYRVVEVPDSSRVLLYIRTAIDEGVPGKSARKPGKPAVKEVVLQSQVTSAAQAAYPPAAFWKPRSSASGLPPTWRSMILPVESRNM